MDPKQKYLVWKITAHNLPEEEGHDRKSAIAACEELAQDVLDMIRTKKTFAPKSVAWELDEYIDGYLTDEEFALYAQE